MGKPTRVGGTSTGAGRAGAARLAACHRFRKGEGVARRQGRRSRPPSLRGFEELGFGCSHVVFQLQTSAGGIWPRISSAYAPPKGRSGSSERGPSSERRSAGQTVGRRVERKERRASDFPANVGEGSAQGPGWCESAIQRSRHRQKRCSGRGTGAVKATGSCEGSPVERRHPGSSRSVLGHAKRSRVVLALYPSSNPCTQGQKPKARRHAAPTKVREAEGERSSATGVSEARSQSVPWEDNAHAHDGDREVLIMGTRAADDPPKRARTP